jgi:ADP-heptose:LPS heptosyltransferase
MDAWAARAVNDRLTGVKLVAADGPSRLLVVRLGAIGDVVRTLPAVRLARSSWPAVELTWVVEDAAAPMILGHPDVDRVLVLPRRDISAGLRSARPAAARLLGRFVRELRGVRPDMSIDFQASFKSGLVARASGAPIRVGFDASDARELSHLFANVRLRLADARISRVERAGRLVLAAGARSGELEARPPHSVPELEQGRVALERLTSRRPLVSLAPFSSRRQSWKRYPLESWAEVASSLAGDGAGVLLLGGPAEQQEMARIAGLAGAGVVPCGAVGLREMAAMIAATDLFVGGDTGPMHMAWLMGIGVVAVYGPTDPVVNAPFGQGHVVLAPRDLTGRADAERFPGITPARIVDAVRERLAGRARPALEKNS